MVQLVEDRDLCALGAAEVGRRIASGRASAVDEFAVDPRDKAVLHAIAHGRTTRRQNQGENGDVPED